MGELAAHARRHRRRAAHRGRRQQPVRPGLHPNPNPNPDPNPNQSTLCLHRAHPRALPPYTWYPRHDPCRYDQAYVEHFTGVRPLYLPTLAGYVTARYRGGGARKRGRPFLLWRSP